MVPDHDLLLVRWCSQPGRKSLISSCVSAWSVLFLVSPVFRRTITLPSNTWTTSYNDLRTMRTSSTRTASVISALSKLDTLSHLRIAASKLLAPSVAACRRRRHQGTSEKAPRSRIHHQPRVPSGVCLLDKAASSTAPGCPRMGFCVALIIRGKLQWCVHQPNRASRRTDL